MKRTAYIILSGLFLFFFPIYSSAKIIETAQIKEVLPLIDDNTWVLVDLDNTFFEAKQALGHNYWFRDQMQLRIAKGMSKEAAIKDFYPDWVKAQKHCPVKAIEPAFIPNLQSLQKKKIPIMGVTNRWAELADPTLKQVSSLGFDFTKTSPCRDVIDVPGKVSSLYKNGILFVSDGNQKGKVFLSFLEKIKKKPAKIIFIDDYKNNIEDLETALAGLNIPFVGIHYTAIEKAPPVYSAELADLQYKFLNKVISNEAAKALIDKGIKE